MGQSYDPLQPSQVRCSCLMDGPSLAIWKLTIPLFQLGPLLMDGPSLAIWKLTIPLFQLGPLSPGGPTFSQAFTLPAQQMRM